MKDAVKNYNPILLRNFISKIELSIRFFQAGNKKNIAEYLRGQVTVLINMYSGQPYILCTYYFPSELANMYDTNFIYVERIVGLAISLNILKLDKKTPLPHNICSYQKAFIQMIEIGLIPMPELIIAVEYPCDDAVSLCKYIHNTYQIPILYIKTQSLKEDLQKIYTYLNKHYIIKNKISDVVEKANKANKLKNEIDFYRIYYPGILSSDTFLKIFPIENDFGSDSAIEILKNLLCVIKKNTQNYVSKHQLRILWMGLIPLYNNNILSKAEVCFPCKFVYEEMWMFSNSIISEEHFVEDMAQKIRNSFFYNVDKRLQKVIEIVKKMRINLVINFSQKNCGFLPQSIPIFQDYFSKSKIEFYNLGCDVVHGNFNIENLFSLIEKVILGTKYRNDMKIVEKDYEQVLPVEVDS